MAISPSSRRKTKRPVKTGRAKPVARKARRPAAKRPVASPATAVLKSFAKLLSSVRASAATLTKEQRTLLKRAMKHAHAALD